LDELEKYVCSLHYISQSQIRRNAIYGLAVYAELVPTEEIVKKEKKHESPKSKKESRTNSNLNDLAVLAQLLHPEQNDGIFLTYSFF
jgi:hypothetical protein